MSARRYTYKGDRLTDRALVDRACTAVLRDDGKCITGRSAMLVLFDHEQYPRVVQRRCLRKFPTALDDASSKEQR